MNRSEFMLGGGMAWALMKIQNHGLSKGPRRKMFIRKGYNYPLPKFEEGS